MPHPDTATPAETAAFERLIDPLAVGIYRLEVDPGPAPDPASLLLRARLRYANHAFRALHDQPGDPIGRPLSEFLPAIVAAEPGALSRFLRTGELDLEITATRNGDNRRYRVRWVARESDRGLAGIWGTIEELAPEAAVRAEDRIVGSSAAIRHVLDRIALVAATDTTVLVTGETGTGKELVARAIHRQSARARQPLVAVNCGAISPNLVESELFGHERGAFTGAMVRKVGRFEAADGGTLFLDEIGDLSLELQVKLLRVLQDGEFQRVGGRDPVRTDVRVVAATNRDLKAAVAAGTFREDLYYRLNVFPIRTPSLRERLDDLPALVSHFVARQAARSGRSPHQVPGALLKAFAAYSWPGNIRQLANLIERSAILSRGNTLEVTDWETGQYQPVAPVTVGAGTLADMERAHIEGALIRARWKVSGPGGAAELLNLKPTTLEARMKRLGIVRPAQG